MPPPPFRSPAQSPRRPPSRSAGAVRTIIVGPDRVGARLDRVVGDGLAAEGVTLSRNAVQRLIVVGAVSVNGRVHTHPSASVQLGYRIVCRLDDELNAEVGVVLVEDGHNVFGKPRIDTLARAEDDD